MSETKVRDSKPPSALKSFNIKLDGSSLFRDLSKEKLKTLAKLWRERDYVVVENALTDEAIALLDRNITYDSNLAKHDPAQFYRTHNDQSCDVFVRRFLAESTAYYSAILAMELQPAYTFAMRYSKNSDMDPHFDNYNNPISSTVCYHFSPGDVSNPIFLDRARFQNPHTHRVTIKDRDGIPPENVIEINLKAGDLVVFRGRNHLHWRKRIVDDLDYRAILLHYFDYRYKDETNWGNESIPLVKHEMINFESYDAFRRKYIMYFDAAGQSWT